MTTDRRDNGGSAFGMWLRNNASLDSRKHCMSASDMDYVVHKFKDEQDARGSRLVQCVMVVEVKEHGAEPRFAQTDTMLGLLDSLLKNCDNNYVNWPYRGGMRRCYIRSFGVRLLQFSGTSPLDSDEIRWDGRVITENQLNWLLGFKIHPVTFKPFSLRRHHSADGVEAQRLRGQMYFTQKRTGEKK